MLHNLHDLEGSTISATDGDIGHVKDFYFEDDSWVVRYLVVEVGSWMNSRKVLISPISVRYPEWMDNTLSVSITREQVRHSPDIDTDKPVSRQNEEQTLGYYGYGSYWEGAGLWGEGLTPYAMAPGYPATRVGHVEREQQLESYLRDERARHRNDDPHLRSSVAVTGYAIHATDGEIGHVSGFLVDDETWAIRYLVVDTSNWWLGHKVLIAPMWITGLHWANQTVAVDLSRASVENAPSYNPAAPWGRDQEQSLYQHYGRSDYWSGLGSIGNTGVGGNNARTDWASRL